MMRLCMLLMVIRGYLNKAMYPCRLVNITAIGGYVSTAKVDQWIIMWSASLCILPLSHNQGGKL